MAKLKIRCSEFRSFELSATDAEKRTAVFAASSEFPVERYDYGRNEFYREILSHDPADVDFSRMDGAPFQDGHRGDVIGVVESAELIERRLVVNVRFSDATERARAVFKDICDGIRRNVSVGYVKTAVRSCVREADGVRSVRFAWQPYEVSCVSVPADPTVGIGRAADQAEFRELPEPDGKNKCNLIILTRQEN